MKCVIGSEAEALSYDFEVVGDKDAAMSIF